MHHFRSVQAVLLATISAAIFSGCALGKRDTASAPLVAAPAQTAPTAEYAHLPGGNRVYDGIQPSNPYDAGNNPYAAAYGANYASAGQLPGGPGTLAGDNAALPSQYAAAVNYGMPAPGRYTADQMNYLSPPHGGPSSSSSRGGGCSSFG